MFFDVVVTDGNTLQNKVFRNGVGKKEAKKLVKELRQKGFKAQFVTSKGEQQESSIDTQEPEGDE